MPESGLTKEEIKARIAQLGADPEGWLHNQEIYEPVPVAEPRGPEKAKKTQAQELIELAEGCELFHTAMREGYAQIEINGHLETHGIKSTSFRNYLRQRFFSRRISLRARNPLRTRLTYLTHGRFSMGNSAKFILVSRHATIRSISTYVMSTGRPSR